MSEKLSDQVIMVVVNRYIGVNAGYLGDFTWRSHHEFYPEYCGLTIDSYKYPGTTRQRFIAILEQAEARDQARILKGVLDRFPVDDENAPKTRTKKLAGELARIADRLEGASSVAGINPRITSEVLDRALADAEALIRSTGATSGIDRVHTAVHAHLIAVCDAAGLNYPKGPSVTQLYKSLREQHPALKPRGHRAEDIGKVLRALAVVLDAMQPVRNMASVAHPNKQLLDAPEAMLVVNAGRSILQYLDAKLGQGLAPVT